MNNRKRFPGGSWHLATPEKSFYSVEFKTYPESLERGPKPARLVVSCFHGAAYLKRLDYASQPGYVPEPFPENYMELL